MSGIMSNITKTDLASRRSQNYITHVALCLDGSGSMARLRSGVIQLADQLVKELAAQVEADRKAGRFHEIRITTYVFDDTIECVYFDMSVELLPSMRDRYWVRGGTALVKTTHEAINDLSLTSEKYGDHAFLVFVLTDGYENASGRDLQASLPGRLAALPDNWSVACMAATESGRSQAIMYGFPEGNVAGWDASVQGMEVATETVKTVTRSFTQSRTQGVRSTKTLFQVDDSKMDLDAALKAGAKLLDPTEYVIIPVIRETTIKEMVEECTTDYKIGMAYYQLNNSGVPKGKRTIDVQGNKDILVMENASKRVAGGRAVRDLAGLGQYDTKVDPKNMGTKNIVFVQSTSTNRKLYPGTKLLLKTGK